MLIAIAKCVALVQVVRGPSESMAPVVAYDVAFESLYRCTARLMCNSMTFVAYASCLSVSRPVSVIAFVTDEYWPQNVWERGSNTEAHGLTLVCRPSWPVCLVSVVASARKVYWPANWLECSQSTCFCERRTNVVAVVLIEAAAVQLKLEFSVDIAAVEL